MTRARGITEEAADAAVDTACRVLRLPTIRGQFAEAADKAEREQLTYRGFLAELLMGECEDRDRRRAERQVRGAGFPRAKWLADFDFDANPGIVPAVVATLATCDWVRKGQPLCLIGDSGTGKSHLLIALGTAAAMAGFRVRYTLASKLANELAEAADDRQLTKTIARYGRADLLCIDLCRHRDYAEDSPNIAGARPWRQAGRRHSPVSCRARLGPEVYPGVLVTGCRGTRGSCRWGGSGPAWL